MKKNVFLSIVLLFAMNQSVFAVSATPTPVPTNTLKTSAVGKMLSSIELLKKEFKPSKSLKEQYVSKNFFRYLVILIVFSVLAALFANSWLGIIFGICALIALIFACLALAKWLFGWANNTN